MIDSGEVAADIGLEYVAHLPSHDLPPKGLQGGVRVATRSKAETADEEVGFEHSREYACDRSLQFSSTRTPISLAHCSVLSPSTPLAAFRFIIRQVYLRNAGVSRCAIEVNRACRSNFAFFAI